MTIRQVATYHPTTEAAVSINEIEMDESGVISPEIIAAKTSVRTVAFASLVEQQSNGTIFSYSAV